MTSTREMGFRSQLAQEKADHDETRRRLAEAERRLAEIAEGLWVRADFYPEQLARANRRLAEAETAAHSMSTAADRHADEYAELEQRLTATQDAARALIAEMQAHADVYGHDMLFLPTFKALAELVGL